MEHKLYIDHVIQLFMSAKAVKTSLHTMCYIYMSHAANPLNL